MPPLSTSSHSPRPACRPSHHRDPFRVGDNILVLCDCYEPPRVTPDGKLTDPKPIPTNTRFDCAAVMDKAVAEEPWWVPPWWDGLEARLYWCRH